jgi:hypothetical protein
LATTTPAAPLSCAFLTLTTKSQLPRSMTAMRPVRTVEMAVQPSAGEATVRMPEMPVVVSDGPKPAIEAP